MSTFSVPGPGAAPSAPSAPAPSAPANKQSSADFRKSLSEPAPSAPEPAKPTRAPIEATPEVDAPDDTEFDAPEPDAPDPDAPEEEDFSWLDSLKAHRQVHGVELEKLVEALAKGELPPELAKVLKAKLKNGADEWETSYADLPDQAMMYHDYHRKLQSFTQEKRAWETDKDEFLTMLHGWKTDPAKMLESLEDLEFPVLDAAMLLAQRHAELDAMTPNERKLAEQNREYQKKLQKAEREQKKIAAQQQNQTVVQKREATTKLIQDTASELFQSQNIPMEEGTWKSFLRKLEAVADSYAPGTPISQEMVNRAFGAMAHVYREANQGREEQQAAARKPAAKQEFSSPAREQIAKAGIVQKVQGQRVGANKGGKMTAADFRKLLQ